MEADPDRRPLEILRNCAGWWRKRGLLDDSRQESMQRTFLPGALQVQETPPSPVGKRLMWVLLALFSLAAIWATVGEVDIVVTAPGRIVPSGQVKIVQALETAAVAEIYIREGQRVKAGTPLIKLDSIYAEAEDLRILEQLLVAERELEWRRRLEKWFNQGRPGADGYLRQQLRQKENSQRLDRILAQKQFEISAILLGLEKQLEANRSEQRAVLAELERLRATLTVLQERVTAYETLTDNQYVARVQYLEMLERQTDMENSVPVLEARQEKLRVEAQSIGASLRATESETRSQNLIEIERLSSERDVLEQESRKAAQRQINQLIRSPVTGTVHELAIHTVGAVVTPAQALMKIVPEGVAVEVEAMLQNKDIGFVREGQEAAIKLDAFNFTKYGLIDAEVSNIGNDAVEDERLGWVFQARLVLLEDQIAVEGKAVKLSPGMSVTAEIKTGRRRLIEFFVSPLLRYGQESVRER